MPEPEELLAAEAEGVVPAMPPVPDGAVEEAPEGPRRFAFLREAWTRLTSPTDRKPSDYTERRLARVINDSLDGGSDGAAHRAQLGESIALAADAAITGRDGAQTPLGHVAGSLGEFTYRRWEELQALQQAQREESQG